MHFPVILYFYLASVIVFACDLKTGLLFLGITAGIHFTTYVEATHFSKRRP